MSTNTTPAAATQQAGVVASAAASPPTAPTQTPPSATQRLRYYAEGAALLCLAEIVLVVLFSASSLRLYFFSPKTAPTPAIPAKDSAPAPPPLTQQQIDTATAPLKADIERRDGEQRAALDRLVTLVGGYSLLIGLTAYFSFKSAREEADKQTRLSSEQLSNQIKFTNEQLSIVQKSAENQLIRNDAEWKRFTERVWSDLPDMRAMQEGLRSLLLDLERIVPAETDWNDEDSYRDLNDEKRQEILLSEVTIAALPTLVSRDSPTNVASLARLYRALARFYFGRYKTEKEKLDFLRADAYVNRAIRLDSSHAGTYRLRGAIHLAKQRLTPSVAPLSTESLLLLEKAAAYLKESLSKDPNDLGAFYNLAITLERQGHVDQGIELVRDALHRIDDFAIAPKRKYLPWLVVNQACDLLAYSSKTPAPADHATLRAEIVPVLTRGIDMVTQLESAHSTKELYDSIETEFAPATSTQKAGDLSGLTDAEKKQVLDHKPLAKQAASSPANAPPPGSPGKPLP